MKIIDTKTGYTVAHAWCDTTDRDLHFALCNLKRGFFHTDSYSNADGDPCVVINGKHYLEADLAVEKDLSPMSIYVVTVTTPPIPFMHSEIREYLYVNPPKEAYTERVVTAEEYDWLVNCSGGKLRFYTGE